MPKSAGDEHVYNNIPPAYERAIRVLEQDTSSGLVCICWRVPTSVARIHPISGFRLQYAYRSMVVAHFDLVLSLPPSFVTIKSEKCMHNASPHSHARAQFVVHTRRLVQHFRGILSQAQARYNRDYYKLVSPQSPITVGDRVYLER